MAHPIGNLLLPCPCGGGPLLQECCGLYLSGSQLPRRAEALMRSRYSAYVLKDGDYLLATWAPAERPPQLNLSQDETVWLGLEILRCTAGQAGDSVGTVEFIARFRSHGELKQLHEVSRFVRSEGRWLYLDGAAEERPQPPRIAATIGRNDPCPCGSGKKSKRCCG